VDILQQYLAIMQRNSLLTGTITTSLLLLNTTLSKAQIIPDRTLPQNTIVRREGNTTVISGGTQQGRNLFHSFINFSVPTNSTALFNNSLDVQNIIARVTGNSASIINGIIQDNGKANLFFINPNGILFGQNANLNIGGSFLGTTADEINFVDGIFSTQHPDNGTLLSINIPIGLKFSGNNGDIQITGSGTLINNINTLGMLNVKNKINNSRVRASNFVTDNTEYFHKIG
jgi:filamentous hemagglutinin family protein